MLVKVAEKLCPLGKVGTVLNVTPDEARVLVLLGKVTVVEKDEPEKPMPAKKKRKKRSYKTRAMKAETDFEPAEVIVFDAQSEIEDPEATE